MNDKHDISALNGLITTTLDSMKGFEDAAEDAKSTRFAAMFADFARDRGAVVASLQAEVRGLGGKPEDSASFLGAAHRSFMDLTPALTGKNDKAIIEIGRAHVGTPGTNAQLVRRLLLEQPNTTLVPKSHLVE